jgi:hypothetical protein
MLHEHDHRKGSEASVRQPGHVAHIVRDVDLLSGIRSGQRCQRRTGSIGQEFPEDIDLVHYFLFGDGDENTVFAGESDIVRRLDGSLDVEFVRRLTVKVD